MWELEAFPKNKSALPLATFLEMMDETMVNGNEMKPPYMPPPPSGAAAELSVIVQFCIVKSPETPVSLIPPPWPRTGSIAEFGPETVQFRR